MNSAEVRIKQILEPLDIQINGGNPWDIQVNNPECFQQWFSQGTLGIGESYMNGLWDCTGLDELVSRLLAADVHRQFITPGMVLTILTAKVTNRQSIRKSTQVAKEHYDLGNDFYQKMLDPLMQYTCAYWKDADNLEDAQLAKLDLICRKLQLQPGERVLELGGGWGGFAYYAARYYKVSVTSYNISKEQVAYARRFCKGLPVEFIHGDYREAQGTYDKIASIGLMEHVGPKNYQSLMALAAGCLKDDGLFLLHTIGRRDSAVACDPFFDKYIFPGGVLPSVQYIAAACEDILVFEDLHNFGTHYDLTLMQWYQNFNRHWHLFKEQFGERFYRMWRYYLLTSAGSFRSRNNHLWQIVLSKGIPQGYQAVR